MTRLTTSTNSYLYFDIHQNNCLFSLVGFPPVWYLWENSIWNRLFSEQKFNYRLFRTAKLAEHMLNVVDTWYHPLTWLVPPPGVLLVSLTWLGYLLPSATALLPLHIVVIESGNICTSGRPQMQAAAEGSKGWVRDSWFEGWGPRPFFFGSHVTRPSGLVGRMLLSVFGVKKCVLFLCFFYLVFGGWNRNNANKVKDIFRIATYELMSGGTMMIVEEVFVGGLVV